MKEEILIEVLNKNWNENGFFKKLRYPSEIDFSQGNDLLENLKSFSINPETTFLNRDLVRLLWYIPQFMDWQKERLADKNTENNYKLYLALSGQISEQVERVLGYP